MIDLKIEQLRINIAAAPGQEHRLHSIVSCALDRFASRVVDGDARWPQIGTDTRLENIRVPSVNVDLSAANDQQAANAIAQACIDALALSLRV